VAVIKGPNGWVMAQVGFATVTFCSCGARQGMDIRGARARERVAVAWMDVGTSETKAEGVPCGRVPFVVLERPFVTQREDGNPLAVRNEDG
jgi:hypothetical protein